MREETSVFITILHEAIFGVSVFPHAQYGTEIVFVHKSGMIGIELFCQIRMDREKRFELIRVKLLAKPLRAGPTLERVYINEYFVIGREVNVAIDYGN